VNLEANMDICQETVQMQVMGAVSLEQNLEQDLRVPKREVPAEAVFVYAAQQRQACLFYLNLYSARRQGEESLEEYLNSLQSFFPLRDKASKDFFIVHVNQILYVCETPVLERGIGRPLDLHLLGGTHLRVFTFEPRSAWRSRPLDLLNDAERFATFALSPTERIHVNKSHIERAEVI
jgi:hypothetical protein